MSVVRTWVKKFLKRHAALFRVRKSKLLGKKRTSDITKSEVMAFLDALEAAKEQQHMTGHNMINYDETCSYMDTDGVLCVEAVGKLRANRSGSKSRALCSSVPFVAADGKC